MQIRRRTSAKALISLVPMVDVMLILLVFFMVTSTYLNLDMVAMVEQTDAGGTPQTAPSSAPLLIRLNAVDRPNVKGQDLDMGALSKLVASRVAQDPLTSFIILPSPQASTQGLVALMDAATLAGAGRLRLIRLEARAP